MAISRYDQFLDNDYSFQQYTPVEWQPNLEVMDEVLTGLQTEYDTGMGQLERIMPDYWRDSESDTQAAQQFRSKYDNLIAQTTDAFTKGNINEGRRLMNEGLREIERDKLPGGEYFELERRKKEYDLEDKKLQTIYLDPKSSQYNPQDYEYYKNKLKENASPFKDEQGNYGTIETPEMVRMYSDEEVNKQMIESITKLPANAYAVGPEWEERFQGMTIGDVMSQGMIKHLDPDKIASVLKGVVGQDLIQSSQERQRIREQEVTDFLLESGEFNPNDPLGQKALNFMQSFSYSQEQMSHRFIPSNLGGEGRAGRLRNGESVEATNTPQVQIVQTPVTTEIKTDNQLAEDGSVLEEDQGLEIYKNTERLFTQKTQSLPETLSTTLQNEQVDPEIVLNGVFYKYMPDTTEEFGTINDADYYSLPSEVFVGDKYNELQQSFQLADPTVTPEQAKMKADKLIKQADYLYMGINEDVAYYKEVRDQYKQRYVTNILSDEEQQIYNWTPDKSLEELEFYQSTIIEPLTDPNALVESINNAPVTTLIQKYRKNGVITEQQEQQLYSNIERYRDVAEGKIKGVTAKELQEELAKEEYKEFDPSTPVEYKVAAARGAILARQRAEVSRDVLEMVKEDNLLNSLVKYEIIQRKNYLENQINKYDNQALHSEISQELLPNLKRSMPVLNYLSQGFDWNSEAQYLGDDIHPIRRLQIDGRGLYAKVNNNGELLESSSFVDSANIYRVSPGEMFEKDGFAFELTKDKSKVSPKDKQTIAGIKPMGFVKGPDNKIYYYGQTQVVDSKESGAKVTPGDYVYYEYSEDSNLTRDFYNALGSQGNVYEDLHFFNKQLDMERITNTDGNAKVHTYKDDKYFDGHNIEIKRNKDAQGAYRYKLYIDNIAMNNNMTMNDGQLAEMLSLLKSAQNRTTQQRGDRNNNPAAFTVALAKQAGLVEGVDYVDTGDTFVGSDGKTYTTTRILGDPIDQTIRVIDKVGFNKWSNPNEGRWTYITSDPNDPNKLYMTNEKWSGMTKEQKVAFLKEMERFEGGSLLNQ